MRLLSKFIRKIARPDLSIFAARLTLPGKCLTFRDSSTCARRDHAERGLSGRDQRRLLWPAPGRACPRAAMPRGLTPSLCAEFDFVFVGTWTRITPVPVTATEPELTIIIIRAQTVD